MTRSARSLLLVAALAATACATAPRRMSVAFEPACYSSVGVYVLSRRHSPLPPTLTPEVVRLLRGRGYTIDPANVTTAPFGGTAREASDGTDEAIAGLGASRGLRGMFVVSFVSLSVQPPVPELSGPIEMRLGMLDVQQKRQVWTITNNGDGDESTYLIQLLMDRVPENTPAAAPPSTCGQ